MDTDARAARIARRQHGLITTIQAYGVGITARQIHWRLRSGRWTRLRNGVHAMSGTPPTWQQAALAAVLAVGPDAVASHITAGILWDFPDLEHRNVFDVCTPRPDRCRLPGVETHRTVRFLAIEHTTHRRIPVTSLARTLVDLSGALSVTQPGRATDHACFSLGMPLDQLRRCVTALPGAPGRKPPRVHAVLNQRVEGYDELESALEMRVLRAIVTAGLAEPVLQHWVVLEGRRARIDMAYPELKLAIEVDGYASHRLRAAFDADRARANELDIAGWDRLQFTSAFSGEQISCDVGRKLRSLELNPAPPRLGHSRTSAVHQ